MRSKTLNKDNTLLAMRHSTEHVLEQAMLKLFPGLKMAMGPATEEGFYFDFDYTGKISEEKFPKIEAEMEKIIQRDLPIKRKSLPLDKARELFKDNPYKQEWLAEIEDKGEEAIVYCTGEEFVDLCAGPHLSSTSKIGPFKLLSVAGAYWHGDEKNKMLTRIYGTAFKTKKELDHYLWQLEEAKRRDHRKLGPQLDLFLIHEDIGKGLPLLTPKGTIIRNEILSYERELERQSGFKEVWTPHIAKNNLYKRTGHWSHYRGVMYAPFGIDNETYVLKPMNCPHHYMIYASKPRSYRDLPLRLSEPGTCYRYEKSGELGGLTRVRALTIDDSHILMREDQINEEFSLCIKLVLTMFKAFGLSDYWVRLSLNDPADHLKYIADSKTWKKAGAKLEEVVKTNRLKHAVTHGEASFYGPKIDFMVQDVIGREWQMSTLQLDLFMAKRLNLVYTDKDGGEKHPVILHRGLTGSIERTIGLLIEHYAGAFPLWLSPIQVAVIPISKNQARYADKVVKQLLKEGVRVENRTGNESMQKRVRNAEIEKIPYIAVLGNKEETSNSVAVRRRGLSQIQEMSLEKLVKKLKQETKNKYLA